MNSKKTLIVLSVLLGLLSIGALYGGGALIIAPSGKLLKMPLSNLGSAPFQDFLIPGIILFSILGVLPGILIYALFKKPQWPLFEKLNAFKDMHWAWTFSIYTTFALILWIHIEMIFLQTVYWMHTFYIVYALVLLFVVLLPQIRNYCLTQPTLT